MKNSHFSKFGGIPQFWNLQFLQIWGNPPNLGVPWLIKECRIKSTHVKSSLDRSSQNRSSSEFFGTKNFFVPNIFNKVELSTHWILLDQNSKLLLGDGVWPYSDLLILRFCLIFEILFFLKLTSLVHIAFLIYVCKMRLIAWK